MGIKQIELKPGVILGCHWGYNCSRYSFYRVEKVSSSSVWLREIGKVYSSGSPNSPCATVRYDNSRQSDEVVCRRVKHPKWADEGEAIISVSEYRTCLFKAEENHDYNECCD